MWPDSSKSFLVPKVEVFKNKISFLNTAWKINEQGALESLLTLLEQFQWNIVGVVHYYDQDLRNVITGFEQRDKEEVCLEFIEKKTYDGKRLVEKILSSASNVTIAIDTYYTTIDYMARAIESGQASPITGKQIVQCCTDTFFDFEDYAPAACQGMLALFQRPRQLSEFQDYLLGIGTQGLENTTLGYFYNLICHPCSAGSLSSMICRNYNTYITTDSMAGPAHTGDFKQCSSDICGDCLHRIAALDTIFMMHSLINTLAPAIEDMNNSHQPTIPQNTSSFDGVEFRTFLLNKYPQILPPNPNAFDVYYWNITADGGMAFVKVDVDLATGASKSYHPENRSVQTQDGGTITVNITDSSNPLIPRSTKDTVYMTRTCSLPAGWTLTLLQRLKRLS
ncbi:uncharacterized protein [Ambystoma mexicanum]|uniref:uncharacterized protein n=1 Tax=Ambystoma mexicanum TaxID=8296 RepID=UPI0037E9BD50